MTVRDRLERAQERYRQYSQREQDQHLQEYRGYAKLLRAWLVAYGVGGPVLFLTQAPVAECIRASGHAACIVYLFLAGVAAQVLITFINKCISWGLYARARRERQRWYDRYISIISACFWLDMLADAASIVLFGWASVWVLRLFVGS